MTYYCPECDYRFSLLWQKGDTMDSFIARLQATVNAPCPRCGLICERCKCVGRTLPDSSQRRT